MFTVLAEKTVRERNFIRIDETFLGTKRDFKRFFFFPLDRTDCNEA